MNIYEIVAYSWAGVNVGIVLGFIMGVSFFYMLNQYFFVNDVTQVDHLKNALLSMALITVKKDDINNDFNIEYKSYDGTKLPPISGCSINNAYLTYIMKNPFDWILYTRQMDDKQMAIQKYLDKNLNTREQMVEFFDSFVNKIFTKKSEEHDSDDDSISIVEEYSSDSIYGVLPSEKE
jgi:hypothetical protein